MFATPQRQPVGASRQSATASPSPEARQVAPQAPNSVWIQLATRTGSSIALGAPDDGFEREAERVADRVTRVGSPTIQPQCAACASGATNCPACEDESAPMVQRKADHDSVPTCASSDILGRLGSDQPLDSVSRAYFEPRFGADFGNVRVHNGPEAHSGARALEARAFTLGSHVAFARGEYAPETPSGRRLLAHELTHVVQQDRGLGGSARGNGAEVNPLARDSAPEAEARSAGVLAELGGPIPVLQSVPNGRVAKDDGETEEPGAATGEGGGVLECLWGIVAGEFIEDPGLCQIVFESLVGLIPYVDQAMDVRDLVAHIYFLGWGGQLASFWRWFGLVFTLIGMIPEVGTLIKGVSKAIRKYLDPILEGVGAIFEFLVPRVRRFGIDLGDHVSRLASELRELLTRNWAVVKEQGRAAWLALIGWFQRQLDAIPDLVASVSARIRQAKQGLRSVREATGTFLDRAFGRAYKVLDDLYIEVASRVGPRRVDIQGVADAGHEVAQARRFGFLRGGGEFEFLGDFQQGIEGFLRPRGGGRAIPVSLKDFTQTGRLGNIISRINVNARQIRTAGFTDAQLLATVRQVDSAALIRFIENGPILNMPNEGVFTHLVFDTLDGVVEVTANGVRRIR